MCHTQQVVPGPNVSAGGPDPDTGTLAGDTVPGPNVVKDTKFGKLLKVLIPLGVGAGLGATANWRQAGSGTQAAESYFARQQQMQMAKIQMQREMANDYFKNQLEAARTQHEVGLPPAPTAAGRTWTAVNPQAVTTGNPNVPHIFALDPYTLAVTDRGEAKPENVRLSPPVATSQGLVTMQETGPNAGTVKPLMGTAQQDILASEPGGPQVKGGEIPLEPEKTVDEKKPKVRGETSTNEQGVSTTNLVDENPDSPTFGQVLKSNIATKQRKPTKNTPQQQGQLEAWSEAILQRSKATKEDPNTIIDSTIPADQRAAVRARIREMQRSLNPTKKSLLSPDMLHQLASGNPE